MSKYYVSANKTGKWYLLYDNVGTIADGRELARHAVRQRGVKAVRVCSRVGGKERAHFELANNPVGVHVDIDVNSHNAKGRKAKTRVNPTPRRDPFVFVIESCLSESDKWLPIAKFRDEARARAATKALAAAFPVEAWRLVK